MTLTAVWLSPALRLLTMVSDAPSDAPGLVLRPVNGLLAGLIATVALLLALTLLSPLSGVTPGEAVRRAGGAVGLGAAGGAALFFAIGAALGLLYAMCQQRRRVRDTLAVGVSYGVSIWVVAGLVSLAAGAPTREMVRSGSWLVCCAVFGLTLALCGIGWRALGRGTEPVVALD